MPAPAAAIRARPSRPNRRRTRLSHLRRPSRPARPAPRGARSRRIPSTPVHLAARNDATRLEPERSPQMDPISPVTTLIDKAEELLGHSPHPAIVALPLGAWTVSNVCDGLALATGDDRYDDAARVSMAIGL